MESRKFEIIQQLMDALQEEMQYGEDELSERLGRKKPEVEVMSVEAKPLEGEELPIDGDEDMSLEDPEEKLKSRLMKLRG
jgi:hypothetical protein